MRLDLGISLYRFNTLVVELVTVYSEGIAAAGTFRLKCFAIYFEITA